MISLSLVVAMANNRAIGKDNQLLWHLPEDLKYFKRITMGKPMIMGRKTFESIGRPLPGRLNIVVTRQNDWTHAGTVVAHSIEEAKRIAAGQAEIDDVDEMMLIGGAQLYTSAIEYADKIYLTRVDAEIEGDAFFPEIDNTIWQELSRESHCESDKNPYSYDFCVLTRLTTESEEKNTLR